MKFFKKSALASAILFQSLSGIAAEPATSEDIAQLQSQLDSLSSQMIALSDENNQLTSTLNQQMTTIKNQQSLITNLQNESNLLSSEVASLQSNMGAVQSNVASLSDVPVGTILAWHKDLTGVPVGLGDEWVICDGQTILDPESELYGQEMPDLVGDKYQAGKGIYLRGGSVSGELNESTQLRDNGYRYTFRNLRRYYGSAFLAVLDAEDYHGAFYSETNHVQARFQVAAMTVVWIMKIK